MHLKRASERYRTWHFERSLACWIEQRGIFGMRLIGLDGESRTTESKRPDASHAWNTDTIPFETIRYHIPHFNFPASFFHLLVCAKRRSVGIYSGYGLRFPGAEYTVYRTTG